MKNTSKTILLLGGTADGRYLADMLHSKGFDVIYSIAGLVRTPKLDCRILVGGFRQLGGLAHYLQSEHISLVINATHPYAATMTNTAVSACREVSIPCWRFLRPAWQEKEGDNWTFYQDDRALLALLSGFKRPLLSAGQMSEDFLNTLIKQGRPEHILWRTAVAPTFDVPDSVTWQKAIGPFALEDERQLLQDHRIDVIVSKNSGGVSTYAKLEAARELSIPVLLHQRPMTQQADNTFAELDQLVHALQQTHPKQAQQENQQQ